MSPGLAATGKATVRRRRLPTEQAVWLVIGMGLFRDRSIQAVAQHLDLVLPEATAPGRASSLARSAVVQARQRLGFEPLSELFRMTAERWAVSAADAQRWRGLAVYGVDGSTGARATGGRGADAGSAAQAQGCRTGTEPADGHEVSMARGTSTSGN